MAAKMGSSAGRRTLLLHNTAVAKRQEPLPLRKVVLGLCVFAAAGSLLYLLMAWIAEDDDEFDNATAAS